MTLQIVAGLHARASPWLGVNNKPKALHDILTPADRSSGRPFDERRARGSFYFKSLDAASTSDTARMMLARPPPFNIVP